MIDHPFQLNKRTDPELGEQLSIGQGPGGLKTVAYTDVDRADVVVMLVVRYGSVDLEFTVEDGNHVETPPGIAHFLEHELFKKKNTRMIQEFSRFGADANAMTRYATTSFYFSTTINVKECVPLLFRTVFEPYFDESFVERERGIIKQELMRNRDKPGYELFRSGMKAMYKKHPLRHEIGGNVEEMDQITPDLLSLCHDVFYRPENMALILAGNVDQENVLELCAGEIMNREFSGSSVAERFQPNEPKEVVKNDVKNSFHTVNPRVLLGFKDPHPTNDPEVLLKKEVTGSLALEYVLGQASPVRLKLYEDDLIDDSFRYNFYCGPGYSFSTVSGVTDAPEEFIERICSALRDVRENGVQPERFQSMKRGIRGSYIQNFDSVRNVAFWLSPYCFWDITPFEFPEVLEKISPEDIMDHLQKTTAEDQTSRIRLLPEEDRESS